MLTNASVAKSLVEEFENKPDTKVTKRVDKLLSNADNKIYSSAMRGKRHIRFRAWMFNQQVLEIFTKRLEKLGYYVTIYSISFKLYEFKISWDKD